MRFFLSHFKWQYITVWFIVTWPISTSVSHLPQGQRSCSFSLGENESLTQAKEESKEYWLFLGSCYCGKFKTGRNFHYNITLNICKCVTESGGGQCSLKIILWYFKKSAVMIVLIRFYKRKCFQATALASVGKWRHLQCAAVISDTLPEFEKWMYWIEVPAEAL